MESLALTMKLDASFWCRKRVLITGHTGFKGSWLAVLLEKFGAEVTGISLAPTTTPNLFTAANVQELCHSRFCDIRDAESLARTIKDAHPEIVFHLAAKALVRASYREPRETFETNVMGTVNVLDALRGLDTVRVAVMVTTDKVYRNCEWLWPYREDDALGGRDPYAASKAASELAIAGYRDSFLSDQGLAVASARAGNVIGGGDWSQDRLIPDAVSAWQARVPLKVRYPEAIRPWQHVLEPLAGYLCLARKLWDAPNLAGAYNFGPDNTAWMTVRELLQTAQAAYGSGEIEFMEGPQGPLESQRLTLEVSKARALLGIEPTFDIDETVRRTMFWYLMQQRGADARALCHADIAKYTVGH